MPQPTRHPQPQRSGVRASDADRERAVELLRDHYEAGRLSDAELSNRVDTAYRVRTLGELDALMADLPSPRAPVSPQRSKFATSVRIHATVYTLVNLMLIAIWALTGAGYFWPIWPMLGWGIGLGSHAAPLLTRPRSSRPRTFEPAPPRAAIPHSHADTAVDEVAASVAAQRPSLRPAAAPDGTVTILFSDIEGSTALNERLGDLRWLELLRVHNRLIRDQVQACQGFEVKSQGDGFMIAFPSARRAIECARGIQDAVGRELGDHPDGPVRVRIGLHTGEAIREDSDFYGRNVVYAARIADEARGGEILASSVVKQLTDSAGDVHFEDAREVELSGLAGTHAVYKVV